MTSMTKIITDAMLTNGDLPQYLQGRTTYLELSHSESVAYAANYVRGIVAKSLEGSSMPEFAQDIIEHAICSVVDWNLVAESLLVPSMEVN
jgi:hypothetical protein